MAIELKFSKPDGESHWGFRLVGGADFNEPLVVVKVNENSFAEDAGLMVGDVIVRVNNTPTAGLTHAIAHELIHAAGYELVMAIRRGLFSDIPVPSEEDNNIEIENILKKSLAEHLEDIEKDQEIGPSPSILENLAGQEQLIDNTTSTIVGREKTNKSKKWSTFLVKPKNPKPVPKKVEEERKIIGDPYRVKIVKQPRRDPKDVLNHKKTVQFEPYVTEVEISRESSFADSIESFEIHEVNDSYEMDIETSVHVSEETIVEIHDIDDDDIEQEQNSDRTDNDSPVDNRINQDEEGIKQRKPVVKPVPLDIHIDPVICESSLSLEQQLAAVQKQLLALAQLPSAIQVTLEAVTQQLNKIVLEKSNQIEENEYQGNAETIDDHVNGSEGTVEEVQNMEELLEEWGMPDAIIQTFTDMIDENISVSENAEGDITENETEDQPNLDELEDDQEVNDDDEITIKDEDNNLENKHSFDKNVIVDLYAGLTDEEKEAKIRDEHILAKKQKIEEERRKMDWTQRPIVLPGGRKWSDPDDALPKTTTPKMSDEKICKTIEDCSEVIVGKTKGSTIGIRFGHGEINRNPSTVPGSQTALWFPVKWRAKFINFLKYQPPPKNLDYLQKSEVYRLIHDMEPPMRGVEARAEKILSEKDYYGDNGAP